MAHTHKLYRFASVHPHTGNFMLLDNNDESPVLAIDFGLAVYFDPKVSCAPLEAVGELCLLNWSNRGQSANNQDASYLLMLCHLLTHRSCPAVIWALRGLRITVSLAVCVCTVSACAH